MFVNLKKYIYCFILFYFIYLYFILFYFYIFIYFYSFDRNTSAAKEALRSLRRTWRETDVLASRSRSMPRSKIDRRFRRRKTTRRPEGRHHDAHDEDISTLRSNTTRRPGGSRHLNAQKKGRHQDAPEVRLLRRRSWGRHLDAQEPHSSTPPQVKNQRL